MPLIVPDRVLGVLDLECDRVGYFTQNHLQTLMLLVPLITNSIENARLYEEIAARERRSFENLRAARTLQAALLLRDPPQIEGLEIAVRSRPAQEISGDVYDFFEQGDNIHVITFGDVSGKGAAAAANENGGGGRTAAGRGMPKERHQDHSGIVQWRAARFHGRRHT